MRIPPNNENMPSKIGPTLWPAAMLTIAVSSAMTVVSTVVPFSFKSNQPMFC